MTKAAEHKIAFIGNTAVGKTSIISQFLYNTSSSDHQPTIGVDFLAKSVKIGETTRRIKIWDTAGQERFRSIIPSYLRDCTVVVLVFSIADLGTFQDLKFWHQVVSDVSRAVLFVVGNKVDLESQRAVTYEAALAYAEQVGASYRETSATAPINVEDLFMELANLPITQPVENAAAEVKEVTFEADGRARDETAGKGSAAAGGCFC
jgi:Ras-related protein Rab-6A